MNISAELAQTIVSDMKEIINQDINYIDNDGIIIASTDTSRIGSYHGGAKRVLKTKDELIIHKDEQYPGARKGINIPVYFEKNIVGVIGITGEKHEVEKYGRILKRMTELLIKEEYIKRIKNQEIENQRMIIEELLFNENEKTDHGFLSPMQFFNIKADVKRVVVISDIFGNSSKIIEEMNGIYNIYNDLLINNHSESLMMQNKNHIIMILNLISRENLELILKNITKEIQSKYGLESKFGIGTIEEDLLNLKISYEKARIALDCASISGSNHCTFYSDMDIEIILENTSENIAGEFLQKVIGNLDEKEINEYREIFNLFEEFNGSIKKISDSLFIHKNTLQYRLNRLCNKTGYDMRRYQDFTILKIAFSLIVKMKNE
jgi:carbohydrate diacid regulator